MGVQPVSSDISYRYCNESATTLESFVGIMQDMTTK